MPGLPPRPSAHTYLADDPTTWSRSAATGYCIGIDLGQAQDHATLIAAGAWPQAAYAVGVVRITRFALGTPLIEVAEAIAAEARTLDAKVVVDMSNQSAFAQLLAPMLGERPQNRLVAAVLTAAAHHAAAPSPMLVSLAGRLTALPRWTLSKRELIEAIQVELENKSLRLARTGDWEALREELSKLQREVRQSGSVSYAAASGFHDDLVTALSLSLFGCRRLVAGAAPRRKPGSRSEPPSSRGWT